MLTEFLTDYSVTHAERVVERWRDLAYDLLVKYNDGYVKDEKGEPKEVGYPVPWLEDVTRLRPEQFRLLGERDESLRTEPPF